jgi:hypothetical protein
MPSCVCVYCVPPWINSRDDEWWFEKRTGGHDQVEPTSQEVSAALEQRALLPVEVSVDTDLKLKCETRNYRAKFHVDELLSHWSDTTQLYDFTHKEA